MKSQTFGEVILTVCDWPGDDSLGYLICPVLHVASPRIIKAYSRRPWIEACFEVCKTTLHIENFKFRSLGAAYGFLALRSLSFALFDYAGRRVTKGKLSAGQIIRTLRYHGTLWLIQLLDTQTLSTREAAYPLSA